MFSKAAMTTHLNCSQSRVRRYLICVLIQFNPGISHSFFLSLEFEPGHCVVDIMPRGSPVHLPPRGVTWDRSYICIEMSPWSDCSSYHPFIIVCGSVVHVTLKPKDAHHRCLF